MYRTISVPYVTVTYTSIVSRFTTNTIVVTSPSGAASTVSVTVFVTSHNTTIYTVTSTTSVAALKPRHGVYEVIKGQLEKYELAPRAVSVSTFTASDYSWVSVWTTFTVTSTFLSGQAPVQTHTFTSIVVNLVSVTTTVVVTATIAESSSKSTPLTSTTATLILTNTASAQPKTTSIGNTETVVVTQTPVTETLTSAKTSITSSNTGGSGGVQSISVPANPVSTVTASPMPSRNGTTPGGLTVGAKAGIGAGVGLSAAASLVFLTLFLLGRRRSKSEKRAPDTTAVGENVEMTKPEIQKPELPSPGPYMGPMPDKPHRETYSSFPVSANPRESVPSQQNLSPSSPTPSSTRFPELGGNSSTQGRAEVSAQPMGFQAPVGSDYEYYELQANEAGRPRSEMRG